MDTVRVQTDPCQLRHVKEFVKFLGRSDTGGIRNGPTLLRMDMSIERSSTSAAFAEQLRAERAAARMTLADLAKRSGLSLPTVKRLEANTREMDTDQIERVCRALGVSIVDFVLRAEARRVAAEAADPLRDVSGT